MPKEKPLFVKRFNPYDLSDVAEVDKIIAKRPFFRTEKTDSNDNNQKHEIKRGILKLDKDKDQDQD